MNRSSVPHALAVRTISIAGIALLLAVATVAPAQQPLTAVGADVNKKLVKIFGAGGFKGLPSYGSGILVSPKGHILTINNHLVATADIRVHLYDGRFHRAKVVAREPELDVAMLQIEDDVDFLPHFEFDKAAARPRAEPGDMLLAFSNCFKIATRDEPMTMQRGVLMAVTELRARIGMFDAPFGGDVYFIDTVTNNPGSPGGALTNRKGDLLGIIGREYKNKLSDTWINYALPIQATADIQRESKQVKVSMATFVKESIQGKYKQSDDRDKGKKDKGGYHGIVFVVNAVPTTPPYVEEVIAGSPAADKLRPDDLIVYVDGFLVSSIKGFRELLRQKGPDDLVKLEVQRGNRLVSVEFKLKQQPKLVKTSK
jgi:serine protease Do